MTEINEKLSEKIKLHNITQKKLEHFKKVEMELRLEIAGDLFRPQDSGKKKIDCGKIFSEGDIQHSYIMTVEKGTTTSLDKDIFAQVEDEIKDDEIAMAAITYKPSLTSAKAKLEAIKEDNPLFAALVEKPSTPTIKYSASVK